MNQPSYSESNAEPNQPENPTQTVEELQVKLARLQGTVLTLLAGLVVALIISIGISGWFAFRSLVQQQSLQKTKVELREKVQTLEEDIASQQRKIDRIEEETSQELDTLTSDVNANQRQIKLLREQLVNPTELSKDGRLTTSQQDNP